MINLISTNRKFQLRAFREVDSLLGPMLV
jgi:hypothetical protein